MKNKCPVCKSENIYTAFKSDNIPVLDNRLYDSEEEAAKAKCGTIDIAVCERCGFVFNREFDGGIIEYDSGYHSERGNSEYFTKHIKSTADNINAFFPLKEKHVLEIGGNTGEFMREALKYGVGAYIIADPSADENQTDTEVIVIRRTLFDEKYLKKHKEPADIIINIHMIEHIEDPLHLLKLFADALKPSGILYLETPRLDWILKNRVFFDFNYEHCSYFTDNFMERMLTAAGFSIIEMKAVYGEQYFSVLARKTDSDGDIAVAPRKELIYLKRGLKGIEEAYSAAEENLKREKDLYLWGASAKGVICANIFDNGNIAGFIDKNPFKQGKYIPNTNYKIIGPQDIAYKNIKRIAVLNDVYFDEIQKEVNGIDNRIDVVRFSEIIV